MKCKCVFYQDIECLYPQGTCENCLFALIALITLDEMEKESTCEAAGKESQI